MKRSEANERIKKAMESLNIKRKTMYTVKEIWDITKAAGVEQIYVMAYLRYGRV